MKADRRVRLLVMTALFAALSAAATLVIRIPSPSGGYMNLGDTVVLMGAYLLGGRYGVAAGAIGPALADLISGYGVYVPGTLCIKALMALAAWLISRAFNQKPLALVLSGAVAEAVMIGGYWLYDTLLSGSALTAAAGIPSNLVQGAFSIIVSVPLTLALRRKLSLVKAEK